MAHGCTASSRLTLSTVLQSVFRAEITSGLRFPPSAFYSRENPFLPRPYFNSKTRHGSKRYISASCALRTSPSADSQADSRPPNSTARDKPAGVKQPENEINSLVNTENNSRGSPGVSLESEETSESATTNLSSTTGTEPEQSESAKKKNPKSKKQSNTKQKVEDNAEKNPKLPERKNKREPWQIHKEALKKKFKDGWAPPKKLSPDAIDGIRHLHATAPDQFTTPVLAEQFKVSPEAIRRILKSKWRPNEGEMEDRRRRWQRRHDRIWSQMSELGLRPKKPIDQNLSDVASLYDHKEGKKPI